MLEDDQRGLDPNDFTEEFLREASRWVQKWGWGFTIIMVVIWPLLTIPAGVFSKEYFAFWVFVSLCWGFTASLAIIVLPIYESLNTIFGVMSAMFPCCTCLPSKKPEKDQALQPQAKEDQPEAVQPAS